MDELMVMLAVVVGWWCPVTMYVRYPREPDRRSLPPISSKRRICHIFVTQKQQDNRGYGFCSNMNRPFPFLPSFRPSTPLSAEDD